MNVLDRLIQADQRDAGLLSPDVDVTIRLVHLRALLDVAKAARNISMNTPGAWGGAHVPEQIRVYAGAALAPLLEDTE